jgi:hypothetical protein
MNEPIESRLRDHLGVVDRLPVADIDAVMVSSHRAGVRMRRRRRAVASVASVALISVGAVAIWANRADAPSVAGTPDETVTATSEVGPAITNASTPVPPTTVPADVAQWIGLAPDPRGIAQYPAVVWTGSEALVVGGLDADGQSVTTAAAYSPATDTWRTIADPPVTWFDPLVAWTGTEMLVVGGTRDDGTKVKSTGYAYDPSTDTWRDIENVLMFTFDESPAAWTGDELLMWPTGTSKRVFAYDPDAATWRELANAPIAPREQAASVWSGSEWIIWGGLSTESDVRTDTADGAAYNPVTDTWRVIAASPLSARRAPAVWTGTEMIVAAGSRGGDATGNNAMALSDGAAYDPATDTWRKIASGPAHPGFVPVWTGTQMVMFAKGGAVTYDVATDRWMDGCCGGSDPNASAGDSPVWTGSKVLLIGSFDGVNGGIAFTPVTQTAAAPVPCEQRADSDLDVANEPGYRQFGEYRDWTRDGCLVRIDVLADRAGPDHCGWQSARVIITGSPLGARYTNDGDDVEYVRDPNNVFELSERFDPDATLPAAAVDTGYRSEGDELWLVPDDGTSIYLVGGDRVERWPRAEPPACD